MTAVVAEMRRSRKRVLVGHCDMGIHLDATRKTICIGCRDKLTGDKRNGVYKSPACVTIRRTRVKVGTVGCTDIQTSFGRGYCLGEM